MPKAKTDDITIHITGEQCVADTELIKLRRSAGIKRELFQVKTPWGVRGKILAHIKQHVWQPPKVLPDGTITKRSPVVRDVLADVITGTLYDPKTGASASPSLYILR